MKIYFKCEDTLEIICRLFVQHKSINVYTSIASYKWMFRENERYFKLTNGSLMWQQYSAFEAYSNETLVMNNKTKMSRLMTKPAKWLCAQRRRRSAWASAVSDQSLRCALNGQLRTQGFLMRTAKTLITLGGCPGWSESSLDAQPLSCFCHVAAQMEYEGYLFLRMFCTYRWIFIMF